MCNFFYFCYNLNILLHVWTAWFTSDKGGKCDCPRCLSVSKIIQKRVHGFQTGVRTWTNWSPFFSPIQIIVQIQELDLHRIFPFEQDYSKHMYGFGWNVACRQMLGHGRTCQLLSPIWIIVQMHRIAFSNIVCTATRNFITSGKITRIGIGRLSLQRGVVLKWFYSPRAVGTPLSEVNALYRVGMGTPLSEVHALYRVPF